MRAAKGLQLAAVLMTVVLAAAFARAESTPAEPTISAHGDAKKMVRRNKVEILELRGASRNPGFLDESFHDTEVEDVNRWNHQHENITPVMGLKPHGDRMPASEAVMPKTSDTGAAARELAAGH